MPFRLLSLQKSSPSHNQRSYDGYDSVDSTDPIDVAHYKNTHPDELNVLGSSEHSLALSTPSSSRLNSLHPQFISSTSSSPYQSDPDSEPSSPLLADTSETRWWNEEQRSWWLVGRDGRRRRRRRDSCMSIQSIRRIARRIIRHPLFPRQPTSIIFAILLFTIFAVLLTLFLMYALNPDKEPLPWRAYCTIPSASTSPPSYGLSPGYPYDTLTPYEVSYRTRVIPPPFPPPNLDKLPPAGVFVGVFSMDSAIERRMLIRSTYASHVRSRNGAGGLGDRGFGTSRTIVRFILGRPRPDWERRIQLEAETYNDMVILPIAENMNYGKTHAFFAWASTEAWVPPIPPDPSMASSVPIFSYSNITSPLPIPVAPHDPREVRRESLRWTHLRSNETERQRPWVRPDFVTKVDDDAFVMLAELEARLRVELYTPNGQHLDGSTSIMPSGRDSEHETATEPDVRSAADLTDDISSSMSPNESTRSPAGTPSSLPNDSLGGKPNDDPLVYWGYLVKNQFMAGELYALSWSIVRWVATDPGVRGMTHGKEDKQVAKWMRAHPRARDVRWKSERCWIYDHPRAGTVYSHGFLFPSEVTRVKKNILSFMNSAPPSSTRESTRSTISEDMASPNLTSPMQPAGFPATPAAWAHSSVSTFGVRYSAPVADLSTQQSIEALVEGSDMSTLREESGGASNAVEAWTHREGRVTRYEGGRVGGTVVVHFIKKNPWFLETALALLEGEEFTELEAQVQHTQDTSMAYLELMDFPDLKRSIGVP
ncbi:hypothetical protein BD410DRAFT_781162 [Rickenella mellea]|uniref:Glycosyltransferase family 31 protein n=1 Tax=Rickenella mellea TaxID=50990 RepID=A0A4Y7QMP5_9AGAM|nr:hypothetical protein BD410DRAFT_781162 [Rickenella mellea]